MTFDEAHQAIKRGDVLKLKKEMPQALDPNARNRFGWSLLMLAALGGHTAVGRTLILAGADLDTRNDFNETASSLAAHKGHAKFLSMLIKAGASDSGRPHGHETETWLRLYSGLPEQRLAEVIELLRTQQTKPKQASASNGG